MTPAVNPYTFTPLCAEPVRRAPVGHARGTADGLSGWVKVQVRARTPLLVGGYDQATADRGAKDVLEPPRDAVTGEVILPGSGIFGALRSTHEALVGGCLRVLDVDYVPVHRHAAIPGHLRDTHFAVVRAVDDEGLPTCVQVCDDVVHVRHDLCRDHPQGPLATGDVLSWPAGAPVLKNGRKLLRPRGNRRDDRTGQMVMSGVDAADIFRSTSSPPPARGYTLLVTDTSARSKSKKEGRRPPAYFAAGCPDGGDVLTVGQHVRDALRQALSGSEDRRRGVRLPGIRQPGGRELVPVTWPRDQDQEDGGPVVGYRLRVSAGLSVGQPIWIRRSGGQVTEIRLSLMWRYGGRGSVGDRAGNAKPCTDPSSLCPTCRIFGAAGADRKDNDGSRQSSYRGHVRADDATGGRSVRLTEPLKLAPRATPKPSAGQFYLDNSRVSRQDRDQPKTEEPAATWGSRPDGPVAIRPARPIAGRKFYWRTSSPLAEPSRGMARPHHDNSEMTAEVRLIEPESTFETRLTFDNLTPAQVGSVLAALDPRLLWPSEADLVTSLGGGKPFGFGAVTVTVGEVQLSPDDRPLSQRPSPACHGSGLRSGVRCGCGAHGLVGGVARCRRRLGGPEGGAHARADRRPGRLVPRCERSPGRRELRPGLRLLRHHPWPDSGEQDEPSGHA